MVWDKGSVRCGFLEKDDGSRVPRFHGSEVAAIAYELQGLLQRRGFLDAAGNQVPVVVLADRLERAHGGAAQPAVVDVASSEPVSPAVEEAQPRPSGKECPDCGGYFLHKVDGCLKCESCGYVGSCG